jgi:hypothetical protein
MIAKYGTFCIIIRQKIAYHGIFFVSNEILNVILFSLGPKVIDQAKQYLSF